MAPILKHQSNFVRKHLILFQAHSSNLPCPRSSRNPEPRINVDVAQRCGYTACFGYRNVAVASCWWGNLDVKRLVVFLDARATYHFPTVCFREVSFTSLLSWLLLLKTFLPWRSCISFDSFLLWFSCLRPGSLRQPRRSTCRSWLPTSRTG